jgi:SagB-type dehydrogenase family enzyme
LKAEIETVTNRDRMPTALAMTSRVLRLRADATLDRGPDGSPVLAEGHVRMPLRGLGGAEAALAALADGGRAEDELFELAEDDGDDSVLRLQLLLSRLETGGWLEQSVVADGRPLATLRPLGHQLRPSTRKLDPEAELALSRFALLRAGGGEAVLESPRASVDVVLHEPRLAATVAALVRPTRPVDLAEETLGQAALFACLQLLLDADLLVAPGEEDGPEQAQWAFADLLFHARSRVGRHVGGYGGTFRFEGRFEPLPAVKPAVEPAVRFEAPDLAAVEAADPSFTRVLESRSSIREHDDEHPLTSAQLGEFLYRSARVRAVFADEREELSSRPYPGGGAVYELELYPLVHNVDGVEPGLYHYDPQGHALELVAEPGPRTQLLLEYGRRTGIMERPPQVLMLVAARFGRAMWKYESMAYALVLKQVGVLYQTMYLVATAMGLAPCALGGGNSDAFAAATGLDYYAETSVGEFLLGSRPRDAKED